MTSHDLRAEDLSLGYDDVTIVDGLALSIPDGQISVIVGANASGKSTLLRGLARLLRPTQGRVLLDGESLADMKSVEVAKVRALLPQTPVAPDGITVGDLVGRGRYPHQGWFRRWSSVDDDAVAAALDGTGTGDLVDRPVASLSGGQRQRVWVAMALAQQTDLLLLDEPTTYLDVSHQIDLLDLLKDLNQKHRTTIVVVLHDLNLAVRYADHLVVLKEGQIVAEGAPADVVDETVIDDVFGLECIVVPCPVSGAPMIVPISRHDHAVAADDGADVAEPADTAPVHAAPADGRSLVEAGADVEADPAS
ncbi:ABC transporter ATP-binding protein [soil metagenome]